MQAIILDTLSSFAFFIISLMSLLGYGQLFIKIFFKEKNIFNYGEVGVIGFFLISFISIAFHFFIPLDYFFNSIILIIGFLYFLKSYYYKTFNFLIIKKINLFSILIFIPSLIFFENHADYFWYHLPYSNIVNEFKIIKGAVNLNDLFGYSHIWYDIIAIFNLPFFKNNYLTILSLVFFYFFINILFEIYLQNKDHIYKIFSAFSIFFLFMNYTNLKNFGSEIQINLIYILISYYIIKNIYQKNFRKKEILIIKILLLYFFSILIRLNSIIILPAILIIIIMNYKVVIVSFKNNYSIYFFIIFFSVLYLFKNFLVTGCLAYPLYFTCFENVPWGSGISQAEFRYYHLSAQSKGYLLKLINEGFIDNIFDYYKYKNNIDFESPKDYLKNFSWIKYWWKYEYDKIRILNVLLILLFLFFVTYAINFKKFSVRIINLNCTLLFIFFIPIISWFLLLPQSRYGGYAIFFVFLTYFIANLFRDSKFYINPLLIFFMLFSLFYFEGRNINRVMNNFNSNEISIKRNQLDKESTKFIIDKFDIPITIRVFSKNDRLGKPMYCHNTKGVCITSMRLKCINKIKIKNNFMTVFPNKEKCSKLIEDYLWY